MTSEERRAKDLLAATGNQFCPVEPKPMTREEHIRAAESLLAGRWERSFYKDGWPDKRPPTEFMVAKAQVHALLAQVCLPAAEVAESELIECPDEPEPVVDEPHAPWLSWLRWGGAR